MEQKIPREKIETGISLCLSRVNEYLLDAERLCDKLHSGQGTLQDASILLTFAVEELGKAIILRKRSEEQGTAEIIQIEDQVFGGRNAHDHKQVEVFTIIGSKMKRLHSAAFSPETFGPDFDIHDVDLSPDTRLQLSFIDFKNGDWSSPPPVEPKRLKAIIIGAREAMKTEEGLQAERFKKIGDRVQSNSLRA